MKGKDIVTMCAAIIKRQDLNTDLLLHYINEQRRTVLRENYLYRIQEWRKNLQIQDGFVRTQSLKQARYVEYVKQDKKIKLRPLGSMQDVYDIYGDTEIKGEPIYYIVLQGGLQIVPKPTDGVVDIYGEWYPPDVANDNTEDTLSKEISDITIYLACAEYFDFLVEPEKAEVWRAKAQIKLDKYIKEIKRQMTDDVNLFNRDPFGNLGIQHGWYRNEEKMYRDWTTNND